MPGHCSPTTQSDFDENQLEDGEPSQVDEVNRIALSSTRSRLFIDCADYLDEAVYTCVAENAFSRISSHTKLNLIKPAQAGSDNDLLAGPLDEVAALEADKAALAAVPQCLSQRGSRPTGEWRLGSQPMIVIPLPLI